MKRRQLARHGDEKEKLNWNDDENDGMCKKKMRNRMLKKKEKNDVRSIFLLKLNIKLFKYKN